MLFTRRPIAPARRLAATAALGLLVLLPGATPVAAAQRGQDSEQDPAPGVSPTTVSEQLTIGPLGVTLFLPEGAAADTATVGATRASTTIRPSEDGPVNWLIRVYSLKSADETLTPAEVADSFIEQQQTAETRRGREFFVLDRLDDSTDRPLRIGEQQFPAARFYATTKPTEGVLAGYTIVRVAPGEFITFQLATGLIDGASTRNRDQPAFDVKKPHYGNQNIQLYETVVASFIYEDPAFTRLEEVRRFHAGAELLSDISSDDLKAIIEANTDPVFLRIYEPAQTGAASDAREIAFQKITFSLGQLGELEPNKPRGSWTPKQREYGFLVSIDARMHHRGITAETRARYFLSIDRQEEYWSTTTVNTREGARSVAQETLVRRGDALTVNIKETAQPDFTRDWNLAEHDNKRFYISRVELYLLPLIIADRFGDSPAELDFNFYAYDSALRRLTQRTDAFSNRDISGWRYTSRRAADLPETEAILDAEGHLVRRTPPDEGGRVIERSTRERVARLWRSKQLGPIDQ